MGQSETQIGICMKCNIFHGLCTGSRFQWVTRKDGQRKMDCVNRVFERDNTTSPMQVEAFMSLYRRKIKGGTENLTAFVEAIVQTSDDAFEAARKKRPDLMEEYYRIKNKKSQKPLDKCQSIV